MSGTCPAFQPSGCPRCRGDLRYDSPLAALICQRGCGYQRATIFAVPAKRALQEMKLSRARSAHETPLVG